MHSLWSDLRLLLLTLILGRVQATPKSSSSFAPIIASAPPLSSSVPLAELNIRGGASSKGGSKKKKKTKRKKTKKKETMSIEEEKKQIDQVLKTQDAAEALGDAIRSRADQLRNESPLVSNLDTSISSVGWALGASDYSRATDTADVDDDVGHAGIQGAPTSVVVHYFLKSHGGAHALQCVCSLLSTVAGLGVLLLKTSPLRLVLVQRCLLFAMIKHVSGLVAATLVAARAIPEIGLSKARIWMEQLATDPVSQYVFYAACVMVWLNASLATSSPPWWQAYRFVPSLLVGAILLREVISTLLVLSDVLVLVACSSSDNGSRNIPRLLVAAESVVSAIMSLLVTPQVWRSADAAQRQAILAKLTSRTSLALEVLVGVLFAIDAVRSVIAFSFASVSDRPPLRNMMQRLVCTRLYLHFLWTRRRKISKLASQLRGGCADMPIYVMDCLMDPAKAMGLSRNEKRTTLVQDSDDPDDDANKPWTWKEIALLALGFDR